MRLLNSILLLLLSFGVFAQYGNEWMNPSQTYYRFTIGENAVYKLDYNTIIDAGIPAASINPKNFQLFLNGEEQFIYVEGQADNTFNPTDYIEFYGKRNDGELDAPLFPTPTDQNHQYMSMYSDSSVYFLTWGSTEGKRLTPFDNYNTSGKTSDTWIWYSSPIWFSNNKDKGAIDEFYDGNPWSYNNPGYFCEYTEGEGWFGPYISGGRDPIFSVPTEHYNSAGPAAKYDFLAFGKSNPIGNGAIIGGINHKLEVSIGNDLVYEKFHYGYTRLQPENSDQDLTTSQIGNPTTEFRFESTYLTRGRHALSWLKVDYPRFLTMEDVDQFEWDYTGTNNYFKFTDYTAGSQPIIYDLTNKQRIPGIVEGESLEFMTSSTGNKFLHICDEANIRVVSGDKLSTVNVLDLDPANSNVDYLIISHKKLSSSVADYEAYRSSATGGNYNVQTVYTEDLYNNFYYGQHHPLALKNYCQFMYEGQTIKPTHVILIGKGQAYPNIRFDHNSKVNGDLVPTWGVPSSDYFFVTDYEANNIAPVMGMGRVPARTNTDVINYLNKVKWHEEGNNTSKTMLQLTGGSEVSEQATLNEYQDRYFTIASGPKLGADRISYSKSKSNAVDSSLVTEIQNEINNGIHVISYFGHGASQVLEIDIGSPSQMDNKGKYPLFMFNGCALGNSFNDISLPEEFLLEPENGAISWYASSSFGFINELYNWTREYYRNFYDKHNEKTLGEITMITMDNYQDYTDPWNRAQCRQMTYHGDPAIRMYAPEKPDYSIDPGITIYPPTVDAESDSFALVLNLRNAGLATNDTPSVHIQTEYSNAFIRNFGPNKYTRIYNNEEVYFWMRNDSFSNGLHKFLITIDYGDSIDELPPLGETNNTREFQYFMPSNRLSILYPVKHSIIANGVVKLKAQNNNVLAKDDEAIFEIDTTPLFNSPLLQNSGIVMGSNIIEHSFSMPAVDSTDFYWRVRFNKPLEEGGAWENSTFAYIQGSDPGWSQGYYLKFSEAEENLVSMDTSDRDLKFLRTVSEKYTIVASGADLVQSSRGIRIEPYYYYPRFLINGLAVVAVEPNRLERFSYPSLYNRKIPGNNWGDPQYQTGDYSGAFWFDMRKDHVRDSFVKHMNKIPEGYIVLLYSSGNSANELWEDSVFIALESAGAFDIRFINNGEPYGLFGTKGMNPGEGKELLPDYDIAKDPRLQTTEYSTPLYPISGAGSLTSQLIGPSTSWKRFDYRVSDPYDSETDSLHYSIIGVNKNGSEIELFNRIQGQQDLSTVDPEIYPNLRIKADFQDDLGRTPVQQKRWTITYEGVPEGTLDPSIAFNQSHDTLQEGDSIEFTIAFKNISNYEMDSVWVMATNRKSNFSVDTIATSYYPPLTPSDSFIITYKIDTRGLTADNKFFINVNPDFEQPEEKLENNIIGLNYYVLTDERNPLLDVVFDGIHILDHDIVSPSPMITMTVLDENEFIFIEDPNAFDVKLVRPGGQVDVITHLLDEVEFFPATKAGEKAVFEFNPQELESGVYELIVKVVDAAGNQSSDLEYRIHFEVIREATITNFYPYPNPFTTNMKFVYTLTGSEIPDYLKIQIMTVTGKVVREITQDEFGLMRIGNNISEFSWNGTDEFGDQLANGVYLFKVTAKLNGEDISNRETDADEFFNQGYGKIYLMR